MPVEIWGDGSQLIDLVHAADVARTLVDTIGGPYGIVTEAGTGKATTVLDAAREVIRAAGSTSDIVHRPMRRGEPEGAVVVAAAPACEHPWPYLLDETIEYYRALVQG